MRAREGYFIAKVSIRGSSNFQYVSVVESGSTSVGDLTSRVLDSLRITEVDRTRTTDMDAYVVFDVHTPEGRHVGTVKNWVNPIWGPFDFQFQPYWKVEGPRKGDAFRLQVYQMLTVDFVGEHDDLHVDHDRIFAKTFPNSYVESFQSFPTSYLEKVLKLEMMKYEAMKPDSLDESANLALVAGEQGEDVATMGEVVQT
jgi:hypothetical protein